MYDLTIVSIFRDSGAYLDRYMGQVTGLLKDYPQVHCIWLEGDSQDDTQVRLQAWANRLAADVTLLKFDTHGPYWPSADIPQRWTQLEACWNQALRQLEPTRLGLCVESDLIWEAAVVGQCAAHLNDWDVVYPMLLRRVGGEEIFYDTNGFRRGGQQFWNRPPFIPNWEGERFVAVETGGGLILTWGEVLAQAVWRDKCVLHFPADVRLGLDTQTKIYHP